LFTSESVTEGHPDKVCDQISDAIVDAMLVQDQHSHVAAECSASTGLVLIFGEIKSNALVDIQDLARRVITDIGYIGENGGGFDAGSCSILSALNKQSADITHGVLNALETRGAKNGTDQFDNIGAGDQGMMFGFACNETPELMPLPIAAANRIARRLSEVRKSKALPYLRPDGKTQVTIEYCDNVPVRVDSVVISTQHAPEIGQAKTNEQVQQKIAEDLKAYVIQPAFADLSVQPDAHTRYLINPSGRFVIGGPHGDAGLTGRKIIVDTYGGYSRHGGGAFSGKDPTKVDRSAAYAARHVAKNLVAADLASRCEVQIAYAIGVASPVSVMVTAFGTSKLSDEQLTSLVKKHFDLRPAAIIDYFRLRTLPKERGGKFYESIAAYGHFGRLDLNLPWEQVERSEELKSALTEVAHV
jgi:S-adenosylmethionine synthetase